jgi:pimeloyl-ACP methyl ester carboxylesterase
MALKALTPEIFGEVSGASPTILALHGWGRDRSDFAQVLQGLDFISVDLPGFGASPPPTSGWSTLQYAEALVPIVTQFETPPVLVGHSFGGRVAAHLATLTTVKGVVFVGTPLFRKEPRSNGSPFGYRLVKWAAGRGLVSDERLEAARRKHGSADYRAAKGVMREVLVKAVNETYAEQLAAIAAPVHMVWGGLDTAAPAWNIERAQRVLPAEPVVTLVADAGHDVHLANPESVREAVRCLM